MPRKDNLKSRWNALLRDVLDSIVRYAIMVLVVLLFFGIILLILGKDPIQSYRDVLKTTLGSPHGLSEVIVAMTPILLTALAVALPSQAGLINVGGDGQPVATSVIATTA